MLRIYDTSKRTTCPWPKDKIPDYDNRDNFGFSKTENFDFDEYVYMTRPVNGYCLTAEITKNKGEKVTVKDLNRAFANSLCISMTNLDFNDKTAQDYFLTLPPEFYTKETYDLICAKLAKFSETASKFEKQNIIERNLHRFQVFANKLNPEQIPAPQKDETKNREF